MATGSYSIVDEPKPGGLSHLVVNPFWPLLGFMLGGTWFGWAWFVVNGMALGSATRRREIALAVGGLIGAGLITVVLFASLGAANAQSERALRLAVLVVTVWKLAISYMLYMYQERSFSIYEYYDGTVKNGLPIAILGLLVGRRVLGLLGNGVLFVILM
jgi:hypothetical protein